MDFSTFIGNIWVQIISLILFATVHGYLGAWLAVRMLFRPRNPIKVLGITVFPQGMIPRHRERLAEAIGKAVGEELVSQETITDELFKKDFLRRKIQSVIDSYSQEILSQNYPSLIEALPAGVRAPVLDAKRFCAVRKQRKRFADSSNAALTKRCRAAFPMSLTMKTLKKFSISSKPEFAAPCSSPRSR
jgi:uncharacterized membrane protein YheB (UPF0754 family)